MSETNQTSMAGMDGESSEENDAPSSGAFSNLVHRGGRDFDPVRREHDVVTVPRCHKFDPVRRKQDVATVPRGRDLNPAHLGPQRDSRPSPARRRRSPPSPPAQAQPTTQVEALKARAARQQAPLNRHNDFFFSVPGGQTSYLVEPAKEETLVEKEKRCRKESRKRPGVNWKGDDGLEHVRYSHKEDEEVLG